MAKRLLKGKVRSVGKVRARDAGDVLPELRRITSKETADRIGELLTEMRKAQRKQA